MRKDIGIILKRRVLIGLPALIPIGIGLYFFMAYKSNEPIHDFVYFLATVIPMGFISAIYLQITQNQG